MGAGTSRGSQIQTEEKVDGAVSTVCSACKIDLAADPRVVADIFFCMQCPDDFVSCAPCFAKLVSHHPRHQFFRGTPSGDLEVNLLGMQHAICEGCGLAVGGLTWTCRSCMFDKTALKQGTSLIILCTSCFPDRDKKHPSHKEFACIRSWGYPTRTSIPLDCNACKVQIRDAIWGCFECQDMRSCDACLPWLKTHNPEHRVGRSALSQRDKPIVPTAS